VRNRALNIVSGQSVIEPYRGRVFFYQLGHRLIEPSGPAGVFSIQCTCFLGHVYVSFTGQFGLVTKFTWPLYIFLTG
jgi:hypothetical protein